MATDCWIFDFTKWGRPEHRAMADPDKNLADMMRLIGFAIVDGPVSIDWADRYGWTALTSKQWTDLYHQFSRGYLAWLLPGRVGTPEDSTNG